MAYLRQLSNHFDPVYIKPANLSRAVSLWRTGVVEMPAETRQRPPRRDQDRRCSIERRCRQFPIMLDTRSPRARRKQSSRRQQDSLVCVESVMGIDVYA